MSVDGNHGNASWFELDPFVSEIVLWIDADVVEKRMVFERADLARRFMCVCEKLASRGVVVIERSPNIVWLPSDALLTECGRSDIFPRLRYCCSADEPDPQSWRRYEKAIEKLLQRRLGFIVRKTVTAFQCFNAGMTVGSRSRDGLIQWQLTEEGLVVAKASRIFEAR